MVAASAWIDLHISHPDLWLTLGDFYDLVSHLESREAREGGGFYRTGGFESAILEWKNRKQTLASGMNRLLQGLEIGERGRKGLQKGTEEVLDLAGLSYMEKQAVRLAMVYVREDGKPDAVQIAQMMVAARGSAPVTRSAVATYLQKAREKMRRFLLQG
jgi:hypothetical protein